MRVLRVGLIGFGHVGRRFAELLHGRYGRALRAAGVRVLITGVASGRHGFAIDGRGLRPRDCLALARRGTVDQTAYGVLSDLLALAAATPVGRATRPVATRARLRAVGGRRIARWPRP